ncbi:MAG: hypothetical protein HeimC3_30160 [Candidatus Heimdallarchaeota archaeon LC_3]|nr:MAG: hypothetical protein HeimC3_30160 [Candidatus Heimdallarchaeota archaeon LC_3]
MTTDKPTGNDWYWNLLDRIDAGLNRVIKLHGDE